MKNAFDRLKEQAFGVTSRLMGYHASWSPSEGGPTQTARINFMGPTEIIKVLDMEYNPRNFGMEYMVGTFSGLLEAANSNQNEEFVTITKDGIETEYFVQIVRLKQDGDECLATLVLKE